jgi:hypothetical protein
MIPALWDIEVHGGIALMTNDAVVTAPRFGDGNWRGGWWAKYDRQTGECMWRRKHRRGAELCDIIGDILITTTHKYSGIYALSYSDGSRIWHRLGYRSNWLLKLFDMAPIDCEGTAPERIWRGGVLTKEGRLLNADTGKVESRHSLEYTTVEYYKHNSYGSYQSLASVDGESVTPFNSARDRDCFPLDDHDRTPMEALLRNHGLELSSSYPCVASVHGMAVAVACVPPTKFATDPGSRLATGGSTEDVQHLLILSNSDCTAILEQYDLGKFYIAKLDWADPCVFSVTTQTYRQYMRTYKRHLWLFEWSRVKELLTN